MGSAAELARKYLQEKQIPIIFETMMTGLMYNKPDDPVDFMLRALQAIRRNPNQKVTWDMFVENQPPPLEGPPPPTSRPPSASSRRLMETRLSAANIDVRRTPPPKSAGSGGSGSAKPPTRPSSVLGHLTSDVALDRPLVLLFGGPGGAKTSAAEKVCDMMDDPVCHIVMSRAIRNAVEKYKMHNEWREAALKFDSGASIPSNLALAVLKAEILARKDDNSIILLEGYPRDLNQVEDFEREVRRVDKAVIIDYDEDKLKSRMMDAGLSEGVVEARLNAYKNQTLPTAKYFDDKFALQLIPGEQDESIICDQLRNILISVLYPVEATVVEDTGGVEPLPPPPPEEPPIVEVSENRNPNENLSKEANVILVVGAPGSLKSEYCKKIVQQYDGFVHLSMGSLLREGMKQNPEDETWVKLREYISKGENVPVELCRDVMYQAMYEYPTAFGFVIEGYPRDVPQAQDFERTIDRVDLVLLIDCTEQFCMNVLRQRTESDDEGKRTDDTVQAVKMRIANFKQHTLPMLKYFDEKGKLKVVEGDKGVDAVYQDVAKVVEEIFIPQESAEGKSLESSKNSKK